MQRRRPASRLKQEGKPPRGAIAPVSHTTPPSSPSKQKARRGYKPGCADNPTTGFHRYKKTAGGYITFGLPATAIRFYQIIMPHVDIISQAARTAQPPRSNDEKVTCGYIQLGTHTTPSSSSLTIKAHMRLYGAPTP